MEIVVIKGCCSGLGSLLIALLLGENIPTLGVLFGMLLLGETPVMQFYVALAIMVVSTVLMVKDTMSA